MRPDAFWAFLYSRCIHLSRKIGPDFGYRRPDAKSCESPRIPNSTRSGKKRARLLLSARVCCRAPVTS